MRDLSMAPAEAAVLLRRAGLELDFEDVQALVGLTEGWPAAAVPGCFVTALNSPTCTPH